MLWEFFFSFLHFLLFFFLSSSSSSSSFLLDKSKRGGIFNIRNFTILRKVSGQRTKRTSLFFFGVAWRSVIYEKMIKMMNMMNYMNI